MRKAEEQGEKRVQQLQSSVIRTFCNNVCKVLQMPTISLESEYSTDKLANQEAKLQEYLKRVLKQAQKGVVQLKKTAQSASFSNVLNQSTDAVSNVNGNAKAGVVDISCSFIRNEESEAEAFDDQGVSFDIQSMASSSNLPSFDASKMLKKQ